MSIWVNREHLGTDNRVEGHGSHHRGIVLSFATGRSNHYPEVDGEYEQPSSVTTSIIPTWCVPGHRDEEDYEASGPWLRLDLFGHQHARDGRPTGARLGAAVVLDIEAARTLAEDLLRWVEGRHVYPTE